MAQTKKIQITYKLINIELVLSASTVFHFKLSEFTTFSVQCSVYELNLGDNEE